MSSISIQYHNNTDAILLIFNLAPSSSLPLTPPLPPTLLSPASASLQLPSVWSSHTKTQPRGAWTRAPASLADCMGLHITSHWILLLLHQVLPYICIGYTHYAGKPANAYFLQVERPLFLMSETGHWLLAGWHKFDVFTLGFDSEGSNVLLCIQGTEGAAASHWWIPLNRCLACPDQSHWEKCEDKQKVSRHLI